MQGGRGAHTEAGKGNKLPYVAGWLCRTLLLGRNIVAGIAGVCADQATAEDLAGAGPDQHKHIQRLAKPSA